MFPPSKVLVCVGLGGMHLCMGGGREGLVQLTSSAGTLASESSPVCSHDPQGAEKRLTV